MKPTFSALEKEILRDVMEREWRLYRPEFVAHDRKEVIKRMSTPKELKETLANVVKTYPSLTIVRVLADSFDDAASQPGKKYLNKRAAGLRQLYSNLKAEKKAAAE